jgi:glutathione peroxidase
VTAAVTQAEEKGKGDGKVPAVLNFKMKTLDGQDADLSNYQGKVVMFVNVASFCGYTKQYPQLSPVTSRRRSARHARGCQELI